MRGHDEARVVASILLCTRKSEFQLTALEAVMKLDEVDHVYLNIEAYGHERELIPDDEVGASFRRTWAPLQEAVLHYQQQKTIHIDWWSMTSSWRRQPEYDQHQVRLAPIVIGRNMAIDYALSRNCSHLLFVDSDVIPRPDGLSKLLSLRKPLVGGLVPGRGAHSHVNYVFPGKVGVFNGGSDVFPAPENVTVCGHGTCGYMLIERKVFGRLRFRWGDDPERPGAMLSEDPAYCEDWRRISGEPFYIHNEATALHVDSPTNPLTDSGAAKDNWESIYEE